MMTTDAIPPNDELLSTEQAARLLAVKPATLYAYVSRGLIRSIRTHGDARSTFLRAEVEELVQRRSQRAAPVARPIGPSIRRAIGQAEPSAIVDDRLYYRDEDASTLAISASFEEVAEWLWSGEQRPTDVGAGVGDGVWVASDQALAVAREVQALLPAGALPLDRLTVLVPVLGR